MFFSHRICTVNIQPCDPEEWKRLDGSCNNLEYPSVGTHRTPTTRLLPPILNPSMYLFYFQALLIFILTATKIFARSLSYVFKEINTAVVIYLIILQLEVLHTFKWHSRDTQTQDEHSLIRSRYVSWLLKEISKNAWQKENNKNRYTYVLFRKGTLLFWQWCIFIKLYS